MDHKLDCASRRTFIATMTLGAAAFTTRGLFADELARTPRMTEGPFYPNQLPLDIDNDLIIISESLTPAVGEITHLSGRLLDQRGDPLRNVQIEIWQVDNSGAYLHTRDPNRGNRDQNFQGYGRFVTGKAGEYYFRTIKPVPYPGRTPHIHVKLHKDGQELLTTQLFIKGHRDNVRDGIFRSLDRQSREAVSVDFVPLPKSRVGELAAKFDIIVGFTPKS